MGAALLVGCTNPNPGYVPPDGAPGTDKPPIVADAPGDDSSTTDRGPAKDGLVTVDKMKPDTRRLYDVQPWPDSVPWQCVGPGDCDDKLSCTTDTCSAQKKCANELKAGTCLIYAACFTDGQLNPANSCEECDSASPNKWTLLTGTACSSDGLSCTQDVCQAGTCQHPQTPGTCLIGGVCYSSGAINPANSCEACSPSASTSAWTKRSDGSTCASDNLWCTSDTCQGGACSHVQSQGCLIGGQCYSEGQVVGSTCTECVTAKSKTASTFVVGKPCTAPAPLVGGLCALGKCAGWQETLFEPTVPGPGPTILSATALNGVDYVSPAKEVWAVGEYIANTTVGGLATPLGVTGNKPVLMPDRLRAISYRLAVGNGGAAYYHDGTTWVAELSIQAALAGSDRWSVWGAPGAIGDIFYMGGAQTATAGGIVSCVKAAAFACTQHDAFPQDAIMGGVLGTLTTTSGQGPLWTARFGDNVADDIYYNTGSGTTWTRASPQGCEDLGTGGATPCSSTTGDYRHVFGSGAGDVWVVGTIGTILRYDGQKWVKIGTSVASYLSYYSLDAGYSSPADKLVVIAAHRDGTSGRYVSLYTYNSDLFRWFGPISIVSPSNNNFTDELRDIGGQGLTSLYMVGTHVAGSPLRPQGWILQLK